MATIFLGAQDEGKGAVVSHATPQLPAFFPGKHNAEHSIVSNDVIFDFHMLPSGLMCPSCMSLIGSGVVFHEPSFFKELETLEAKGLTGVRERIVVSDRCHVNLDLYAAVYKLTLPFLAGRGIGHSYSTKAARSGIRVHEIFDQESFEKKLRKLAGECMKRIGDLLKYDVEDEIQPFQDYRSKPAEFCVDAVHLVHMMQKHNAKILVEGANALLLDVDYGTYPRVTSSNTGLGGVFTGLAIHSKKIESNGQKVGVVKAYRPTEPRTMAEIGAKLRTIASGREWGATTGRMRRCGWIDLCVLKYSTAVNHYTCLNPSKLDILERCEVVYHEIEEWQQPTTHTKTFEDLPKQAKAYVKLIEGHCGVPIAWIGTGPGREGMIIRPIPAGT
ncbi:Adenylosuccinate synthetase [Xylaria acuta]|nr:Adenylosuccinate synthetase [Xylaria acuta]